MKVVVLSIVKALMFGVLGLLFLVGSSRDAAAASKATRFVPSAVVLNNIGDSAVVTIRVFNLEWYAQEVWIAPNYPDAFEITSYQCVGFFEGKTAIGTHDLEGRIDGMGCYVYNKPNSVSSNGEVGPNFVIIAPPDPFAPRTGNVITFTIRKRAQSSGLAMVTFGKNSQFMQFSLSGAGRRVELGNTNALRILQRQSQRTVVR